MIRVKTDKGNPATLTSERSLMVKALLRADRDGRKGWYGVSRKHGAMPKIEVRLVHHLEK